MKQGLSIRRGGGGGGGRDGKQQMDLRVQSGLLWHVSCIRAVLCKVKTCCSREGFLRGIWVKWIILQRRNFKP